MKLEYVLKFRDQILFSVWHQLMSVRLQVFYVAMVLLIILNTVKGKGIIVGVITFICVYLIFWILQQLLNILLLISTKNRALLTTHRIEVQDDSFYEETKYNKSYNFWPGVVSVVSRPGVVAVYISAHGAHLIPNRAFNSSAHKAEFVDLIKQKIASA